MPNALVDLRRFQVGEESTAGTAVAATEERQVNTDFSFAKPIELQSFDDQVTGTRAASRTAARIVREASEVTETKLLRFDELVAIMGSSIRGSVSPTTPTTPSNAMRRIHTYTDRPQLAPGWDFQTLRFAYSDGAADVAEVAPYGFVTTWAIAASVDSEPTVTATWRARKAASGALTTGLGFPGSGAFANRLWIGLTDDSSWAGAIGTAPSAVNGVIRDYTATFTGGPVDFDTGDLRRDQDFSDVVDQAEHLIAISGTAVVDTAAAGWFRAHRGYQEAGTPRYLGFIVQGDDRDPTFPRECRIVARMEHAADSLRVIDGSEASGQQLVSFNLVSKTSGTNHFLVRLTV